MGSLLDLATLQRFAAALHRLFDNFRTIGHGLQKIIYRGSRSTVPVEVPSLTHMGTPTLGQSD